MKPSDPLPSTEVRPRTERRRYTATYEARIHAEAEAATTPGAVGALLRREGLYSSHLSKWRAQQARGGLEPRRTGPKPASADAVEAGRLRRENARLRAQLERAQKIIEVQKKLAEILGIELPKPNGSSE